MLISAHIPKTASTNFCNFLLTAFRKRLSTHYFTYPVSWFRINRKIPVVSNLQLHGSFEHPKMRSRMGDRRRIDFLIAGTQKGGTTALDAYLRNHPEICMASRKEAHFFDDDRYFQHKQTCYHEYHSLFKPKRTHRILGEATPIYMYWKSAPARIWEYNPRMKIIIILRNPIQRAYSHWYMEHGRSNDSLCFRDALQAESQRCMEAYPYQHRIYSYTDRGFYLEQLKRIWTYFPKHQTLILMNEDLKTHPQDTLHKVCNFLGVNCFRSVVPKNVFSASYVSTMTSKEREYLINVFDAEIRNLEQVLGLDCHNWLPNRTKPTIGAKKALPLNLN
jgi:hypothetical protein